MIKEYEKKNLIVKIYLFDNEQLIALEKTSQQCLN